MPFRLFYVVLVVLLLTGLPTSRAGSSNALAKEAKEELNTVLSRFEAFSKWSDNNPGHIHTCKRTLSGKGCGIMVRDSGINKLELFLTKAVRQYLKKMLQMGNTDLVKLYTHGHKCSSNDAESQEKAYFVDKPHICSEVEFYKIIHAVLPDLKTFVDVGANRGYIGSLMVSLWGGGGTGVSPHSTYLKSIELDLYPLNRNPYGYCKTGHNLGYPILCPDTLRGDGGMCSANDLAGLRVMSLDGSPYLRDSVRQVIASRGLQKHWTYDNYAVSDAVGTISFTKQSKEDGAGLEGGAMFARVPLKDVSKVEQVAMTTIDAYLATQTGVDKVDFLKIDAEGYDMRVLLGAKQTLMKGVKVVIWEAAKIHVKGKAEAWKMMFDLGFECYAAAFRRLYKLNPGCLMEDVKGKLKLATSDWGNVICANRHDAPALVAVLDGLALVPLEIDLKKNAWNVV